MVKGLPTVDRYVQINRRIEGEGEGGYGVRGGGLGPQKGSKSYYEIDESQMNRTDGKRPKVPVYDTTVSLPIKVLGI